MQFNSLVFIFLFFPVVFIVFRLLKGRDHRLAWLTLAGYVFYGYWNYKFCALLAFLTLVNWWAGNFLARHREDQGKRSLVFWLSLVLSLSPLIFFKYSDFLMGGLRGLPLQIPKLDLALPLGISFYTFQAVSYTIDIYREQQEPAESFLQFACFTSLFTQLISGPIVRFGQLRDDLFALDKPGSFSFYHRGIWLFVLGLAKKALIADSLAPVANQVFSAYQTIGIVDAWKGVLAYTYQIYFDFSGYSDMAMGIGLMLGLQIPANFQSPYQAESIADFWRRWHISLSTWLKDYVFFTLQVKLRYWGAAGTVIAVMVVFLLCGVWHGDSLNFVLWGAYHGILMILYYLVKKPYDRMPAAVKRMLTFFLVMMGWVVFRSDGLAMAGAVYSRLFALGTFSVPYLLAKIQVLAYMSIVAALAGIVKETWEYRLPVKKIYAFILAVIFVICIFFVGSSNAVFLYFQF
jgi:alginate O-acetyltransferase complex protein AlgI